MKFCRIWRHGPKLVPLGSLLATGCASSPRLLDESFKNTTAAPVTVQQVFSQVSTLNPGKGPDIPMLPGKVPLVTLDSATVLAVPAIVDGSRSWKVTIRSHVVRRIDGTYVCD